MQWFVVVVNAIIIKISREKRSRVLTCDTYIHLSGRFSTKMIVFVVVFFFASNHSIFVVIPNGILVPFILEPICDYGLYGTMKKKDSTTLTFALNTWIMHVLIHTKSHFKICTNISRLQSSHPANYWHFYFANRCVNSWFLFTYDILICADLKTSDNRVLKIWLDWSLNSALVKRWQSVEK